jgi:hypothetical protein
MKRVRLARNAFYDFAIKLRGLGKFFASMQRKHLLQALGVVTVRPENRLTECMDALHQGIHVRAFITAERFGMSVEAASSSS